jgi:hypothetical protein
LITANEIAEINHQIRERSQVDHSIPYGAQPGETASLVKLNAIVGRIPPMSPVDQDAWLLRAIILVQPFPDANHRTAVLAAEFFLKGTGVRFEPSVDAAKEFQRRVTAAPFKILGGYDDAPLAVLVFWHDDVMEICRSFVRAWLS